MIDCTNITIFLKIKDDRGIICSKKTTLNDEKFRDHYMDQHCPEIRARNNDSTHLRQCQVFLEH